MQDRATPAAGKLLLLMEALQEAGYRPTVYHNFQVANERLQEPQLVERFDPVADDPRLDLQGANRSAVLCNIAGTAPALLQQACIGGQHSCSAKCALRWCCGLPTKRAAQRLQPSPCSMLCHASPIRCCYRCRLLGLAMQRPEWSPTEHRRFMPFKRAVQTLLLAVHRERRRCEGGSTDGRPNDSISSGPTFVQHLTALPNELVLRIVGQAAYPLTAWAPGARANSA